MAHGANGYCTGWHRDVGFLPLQQLDSTEEQLRNSPSATSSGLLAFMAELTCCLNLLISSVGITVHSGSCEREDRRGLFHEMGIGKVLDSRDIYCIVLNT